MKTFSIATILALACGIPICAASGTPSDLPPASAPGAVNPNVTQENLATTVCVPNWTKTVRPPASYTNKLKAQQMKDLGLPGKMSDYEEDHRLDLACGGNPTSPLNLYPQPWNTPYGAHTKDIVESYEHRRLCKGEITLAQCQAVFLAPNDWRKEYDRVYGPRTASK